MNKSIKLNLLKLFKAGVMEIKGKTETKKCIVIPIEENGIYVSLNKDNTPKSAYLAAMAWENRDENNQPTLDEYGNSHVIVLSMDKKEEEKVRMPIIGNARTPDYEKKEVEAPTAEVVGDENWPF